MSSATIAAASSSTRGRRVVRGRRAGAGSQPPQPAMSSAAGSSDATPVASITPLIDPEDDLFTTVNDNGRSCTGVRVDHVMTFMALNATAEKRNTVIKARNNREWKKIVPGARKGVVKPLNTPALLKRNTKNAAKHLLYIAVAAASAAVLKFCGPAGSDAFMNRLDLFRTTHTRASKPHTR